MQEKQSKKEKPKKLKDFLVDKLNKEEIKHLISSFDIVGSIAIIEIKPELRKKEKIIGQAILELHKQIKTVCKKIGDHTGTFRTQKLKVIAGEKTKETTLIESGCQIKLNVEKCYFSVRSGTERLRIVSLIKDKFKETKKKESVLVMFSGVGPFVCSVAKNAKENVSEVIGVELNPTAHDYAKINLIKNKLQNTQVIQGDVRKIVPNLKTQGIGIKTDWRWRFIKPKIREKPSLFEFYIREKDLESKIKIFNIKRVIKKLSKRNINVMLHMPHFFKNKKLSLSQKPEGDAIKKLNECIRILNKIKVNSDNVIGFIIHASAKESFQDQKIKESKEWLIENLNNLRRSGLTSSLFLENGSYSEYFGTKKNILEVIEATKLQNLCFDFAHYMNIQKIKKEDFIEIISKINTYFHVVNTKYNSKEHCCRLREGSLDFVEYADFINKGCIEVYSKNEKKAFEQIEDRKYFLEIKKNKTFDRILMPLPKTAEEFLDVALKASKKGTLIHLYGFLAEEEFSDYKEKVIKISSENDYKVKIHNLVKCGQFSPRIYRICVDFEIV